MILHRLNGCSPTPLAHYLKALGILRLVAEQADSEARGWWEGERFLFASNLDEADFLEFFLKHYSPTPLLSPWNAGSGFFRTWDPKKKLLRKSKNAEALSVLLEQGTKRWQPLQDAYKIACDKLASVLNEVNVDEVPAKERSRLLIVPTEIGPIFPVADKDDDKPLIQRAMSEACSENPYFRSAIVDMGETFGYPSLWGTGGNDGAIDFTGRFFENLIEALITNESLSSQWLNSSLYERPSQGLLTGNAGKVGQFLPSGAGGANSTNGPGTQKDTLLNPWDFILMMEGAVLFTAATTRRLNTKQPNRAASPYAVSGQSAGYASSSETDEGARGEQWMPLWVQPLALPELKHVLAEGRAQLGGSIANEPLDLARAIARHGMARGITSFQRYGYIKRNGDANFVVPLGRFIAADKISPRLTCLDDVDSWLRRIRREARLKNAPARLKQAEHRLADALFAVTQHPDEPAYWQTVLLCMADIEAIQITGSGYGAGPIPRLRPGWALAADDGSAEFRLALACALQAVDFKHANVISGVREHWLPLDGLRYAVSGTGAQTRLQNKPDCVMQGRSGLDDAIALVTRRLITASQRGERRLPLQAAYRAASSSTDISRFITGEVDVDHTLQLARALMALDADAWSRTPCAPQAPHSKQYPDDAWLAIRLALLPWSLPDGRKIGADPAIVRRLISGDAASAVELACRRLRAAGINTTIRTATTSPETAKRWAAALAFPITTSTAARFLERLDPNTILAKETAA